MGADRPLGVQRLVDQIRAVDPDPLRGVALFTTAGTISAVMKAENPMIADLRGLQAVRAKAAASGLPPVMALAVGADSVGVYPMTPQGELRGPLVVRWHVGDFRAGTRPQFISLALTVILRDGDRFDRTGPRYELETKRFPLGPNRFNARIAQIIVQMGQPAPRAQPHRQNDSDDHTTE